MCKSQLVRLLPHRHLRGVAVLAVAVAVAANHAVLGSLAVRAGLAVLGSLAACADPAARACHAAHAGLAAPAVVAIPHFPVVFSIVAADAVEKVRTTTLSGLLLT